MYDLGVWPTLIIIAYVFVIVLSISVREDDGPGFWVKILFWPITVLISVLGIIFWLLIVIPRKLFNGICICFNEIKDFFIDVWESAISSED